MTSYLHIENHGSFEETPQHLVLIHGWGMHGGVWQPLVRKLSKYFYLHIVDLPGMGLSQAMEPSHLQAITERLLEALPPQADICGWSLGGLVSMRIAMIQPERVRRLVLVGSTPCFVNRAEVGVESWVHGVDAEVFRDFAAQISADYQATLIKFLTLQCMGSSHTRSTVKQLRASFTERPTPTAMTLKSALRILLENDLREEIETLRKPTLLIHGDRDTLAPVQAAHWMSQHLPAGFLRVIAGASHAPFLSHPEQFTDALIQFLEPAARSA
ncbi:pimeloyl-[acyl-carrier protein] methyl ester esterase [Methylophilaceae bacterium]|nr:pimeloyl-[acyl-carrier protein] methyl ester esterase [Methylophilaceae bacterium]